MLENILRKIGIGGNRAETLAPPRLRDKNGEVFVPAYGKGTEFTKTNREIHRQNQPIETQTEFIGTIHPGSGQGLLSRHQGPMSERVPGLDHKTRSKAVRQLVDRPGGR